MNNLEHLIQRMTNPPRSAEEQSYEVEGIRFAEGIPQEYARQFAAEVLADEQNDFFSLDTRPFLDHNGHFSTAPLTRKPLLPYIVHSGKQSPADFLREHASEKRARLRWPLWNPNVQQPKSVILQVRDEARTAFEAVLRDVLSKASDQSRIYGQFHASYQPQTAELEMPLLTKIEGTDLAQDWKESVRIVEVRILHGLRDIRVTATLCLSENGIMVSRMEPIPPAEEEKRL